MIDHPNPKKLNESKFVFEQSFKAMGFAPNSLKLMAHKNNILGSFTILFANIRGFADTNVSPWNALKMTIKNLMWGLKAKKAKDEEVPLYLKFLTAYMSSLAAGSRYCQAHSAHGAHHFGAADDKIDNIWDFENSPAFSEAERAALRFGFAAGSVPNLVTPEYIEDLKKHFTESQIVELVSMVALYGFLNRWNDSLGTQLEDEPMLFARQALSKSGWEPEKHGKSS